MQIVWRQAPPFPPKRSQHNFHWCSSQRRAEMGCHTKHWMLPGSTGHIPLEQKKQPKKSRECLYLAFCTPELFAEETEIQLLHHPSRPDCPLLSTKCELLLLEVCGIHLLSLALWWPTALSAQTFGLGLQLCCTSPKSLSEGLIFILCTIGILFKLNLVGSFSVM